MLKVVSYVIIFFWFPMLLDKPHNPELLQHKIPIRDFIII